MDSDFPTCLALHLKVNCNNHLCTYIFGWHIISSFNWSIKS